MLGQKFGIFIEPSLAGFSGIKPYLRRSSGTLRLAQFAFVEPQHEP
jgi:hypothetical protein